MSQVETMVGSGLRLTCSREELMEKLTVVSRAVSMRPTVQILSGVWLQASDGSLELAATDMELSLRSSLQADIASPGTVVVPGRLFVDIARLLPAGEVEIAHSREEGRVSVVSGTATYSLHTHSAEDFPRLPEVDAAQTFSVVRGALLETITRVGRSASRDESRPVLTGILVRFGEARSWWRRRNHIAWQLRRRPSRDRSRSSRRSSPRARSRSSHASRAARRPSSSGCTKTT